MTSPDRLAQARRIDEEIAELQRRKQEVLEGRGGTATVAQLREQLHEVLARTSQRCGPGSTATTSVATQR